MDSQIGLQKPILDGAIRSINFFNGRLLTAGDLTREQAANREVDRRLGRAIGEGIAYGLEVSKSGDSKEAPAVKIEPGLAINRRGQTLMLGSQTEIGLVRQLGTDAGPSKIFSECLPLQSGTYVAGEGVYLLTVAPAETTEGRAPTSGLQAGIASCNTDALVTAIQFRLIQLNPPITEAELDDQNHLRNVIAYKCFGVSETQAFIADSFGRELKKYGLLDSLRPNRLTDCDVPLAVLYWTASDGIKFVDMWSVRRRLELLARERAWPAALPCRAVSTREAVFSQFHEHIQDLLNESVTQFEIVKKDLSEFFVYLPPIGLVPIAGTGSSQGFGLKTFFGTRQIGTPTVITADDVLGLFRRGAAYSPLEVKEADIVQLYWVKENLESVQADKADQIYVVFATRELHGFLERDDIVLTLGQTWKSYAGLLKKLVLLPKSISDASLPLWTALNSAQQNIIQYAMTRESAAAGGELNRSAVLATFDGLYALQKDLVQTAQLTFAGDIGLPDRQNFTVRLNGFLDDKLSTNAPGLKPSIAAGNVRGVLNAQEEINRLASTFSGEVAFGNLQLGHIGSPDGTKLKPGDPKPFTYLVSIINRTDKRVAVQLVASIVESKSGSWGSAVAIKNSEGLLVDSVDLNPDQESVIKVEVLAPNDAHIGEPIRLEVVGTLPPPTDKSFSLAINLETAAQRGDEVAWRLLQSVVQRASGRTNATPGNTFAFIFDTEFLASRDPKNTQCTLKAKFSFTGSTRVDWDIFVFGHQGIETAPNSGILSYTFPLPASGLSGRERTDIRIVAPSTRGAADKVCTFNVEVSTDVTDPTNGKVVQINSSIEEVFSVTVKAS